MTSGLPTLSPLASSGSPKTVADSIRPTISGAAQEASTMTASQDRLQRAVSTLPRYSKATPLPMSTISSTVSGR